MGASTSKIEEDKALQLCCERRKFVRQALDGRCLLAATHVAYIQSLRRTGVALRKFVEPEAPIQSSLYTSTSATPEQLALTEQSLSHLSSFSPILHPVDASENLSPSPPNSSQFHVNYMEFRGFSSEKVEEKPPAVVRGTVTMSSTLQNTTPCSTEGLGTSPFEDSPVPLGTPQWDYFELSQHPSDHFSFQDEKKMMQGLENTDDLRRLREEEGIPELEDEDEQASFHGSERSRDSEVEFEDNHADILVPSFENVNRVRDHVECSAMPKMLSFAAGASETELLNGEKSSSASVSPLKASSLNGTVPSDMKKIPDEEDQTTNKVSPKDFFSSIKHIEYLFIKASESGQEVPRMLEANKLHFRPIVPTKKNGSLASTFFRACFSCGKGHSIVQEEPAQNAVKYLTWHRTTSSRSSSTRNPLGLKSMEDSEDLTGDLLEHFCMISGSHASTLDRLYAWEKKLYDEVKASEMVRRDYDVKCKLLRQLESKGESSLRIDKIRAVVKDLHSRIGVAIHRIDSISKRIEELRDKELQPQLEELIKGLSRMWEVMSECHRLQFNIISIAYNSGNMKISVQSEAHWQITLYLERELYALASSFTKWIGAQRSYLDAINSWLLKCVFLSHKPSKRKRRQPALSLTLRNYGPPVYVTCGVWLDKLAALPVKEVADSMKELASETAQFLPRQEKKQGKSANSEQWKADNGSDSTVVNMLRDECVSGLGHFKSRLEGFLGQLNHLAESSVKMFTEVEKAIRDAKSNFEKLKSQVTQVETTSFSSCSLKLHS